MIAPTYRDEAEWLAEKRREVDALGIRARVPIADRVDSRAFAARVKAAAEKGEMK